MRRTTYIPTNREKFMNLILNSRKTLLPVISKAIVFQNNLIANLDNFIVKKITKLNTSVHDRTTIIIFRGLLVSSKASKGDFLFETVNHTNIQGILSESHQ